MFRYFSYKLCLKVHTRWLLIILHNGAKIFRGASPQEVLRVWEGIRCTLITLASNATTRRSTAESRRHGLARLELAGIERGTGTGVDSGLTRYSDR